MSKEFLYNWLMCFCAILMFVGLNNCGKQGPKGDPGQSIVGPSRAPGPVGPSGTPGTVVIAIQFCPGSTPQYPSTFPEYAFCVDGNLYAVYSANGGFLALIPPGQYNSNAVGSACDFTVGPNCEIIQ